MKKLFSTFAALGILLFSIFAANLGWALTAHAASANLLANASAETNTSGQPDSWSAANWGSNTATFNYLGTGHTGSHSLQTVVTNYTNGAAEWYPTAVTGKSNTSYTFSDWYQSNATSTINVAITTTDGQTTYLWGGDLAAQSAWTQASYTFTTPANTATISIYHTIESNGQLTIDDSSLVDNTVNAPAPTVSISQPLAGATVNGTTVLAANASDSLGITSVQFKVDGTTVGTATSAPYTFNWDSTKVVDGTHVLTAVATDAANQTATSTPVNVTVQNSVTSNTGPNLIANPSFETTQNGTSPSNWLSSNWGTNTSTFSYLTTGHTGSRSVEVQTTKYTNGAANWYYNEVPVTAGQMYQYTNWYKSNVDTEVDAEVTMNDGSVQYYWLGTVLANTNWTKFSTTFVPPAGAKSMSVYQILAKVGYIISDDYSLNTYTPLPFNRGIVSVSFDDGWANQYKNALPVMKKDGLIGTYNIISGEINDTPDYMTLTQIKALLAGGNEIASHSVTHPDLTKLTQTQLVNQMKNSQATLQKDLGVPITDFAYPYGAYNSNTLTVGSQYYQSQRTVNAGYNTKDNLDLTQLKIYEVDSNISQAQVKAWIDGAIADHAWLILVYHEVATTPSDPTDSLYTTQPTDFSAEMSYLKSTGVAVETVHQAINEVLPQTK